ncbi:MAG: Gfo/Idh/MocA family oxidoreductase [Alphaproteobacteria bacterium GM202ARS2]|nr:Gfo/Idh/MocA family oxidoreductase [Alphaproteobacteria bacterium GM202ARS2]
MMEGAILGYGTIAAGHHEGYLQTPNLRISCIVDERPQRREAAKKRDPDVAVFSSMKELFGARQPHFIDICTPPSMHLDMILAALAAGCHVLCEKPFLLDLRSFDYLLDMAKQTDTFIYPSHNYKFSPVMRRLVEQVRSPEFGQVLRGFFQTMRKGHARGVPEWRPDWRRDLAYSGGGIIQDHATHSIYLACYLCNSWPEAASCVAGNLSNDVFSTTEDTVLLNLYFPNSVQISLDLTWSCAYRHTAYTLIGSKQNIIVENDDWWLSEAGSVHRQNVVSDFNDPTHRKWFVDMFQDFKVSIGDADKQRALLREAWMTCAVIQTAYESVAERGAVRPIPEIPSAIGL